MNTRQLRHFIAVMDLGSLSAAADSVHLSLPALSRSLRALEDALRVPLFDREGRRLRPTPYALAYVERARRMVFDEREGTRELTQMREGEAGTLAFGMGSSLAHTLLGPMMLELAGAAPRLHQHAIVQSSDALFAALVAERLDFIVGDVRVAHNDPDMQVEPIYPSTFGWFARTGHALAGRSRVGIGDLSAHPMVMSGYAEPETMRRMARLYGLRPPIEKHFALNANDVGAVHTILRSSDAVAPSTAIAMVSELSAGRLVALDVAPSLDLDLTLGIIRRRGRTLVPAAEQAFAIVRRFFADATREIARLQPAPVRRAPRKRAGSA